MRLDRTRGRLLAMLDARTPLCLRNAFERGFPRHHAAFGVELRHGEKVLEAETEGGTTRGSPHPCGRHVPVLYPGRGVRAKPRRQATSELRAVYRAFARARAAGHRLA